MKSLLRSHGAKVTSAARRAGRSSIFVRRPTEVLPLPNGYAAEVTIAWRTGNDSVKSVRGFRENPRTMNRSLLSQASPCAGQRQMPKARWSSAVRRDSLAIARELFVLDLMLQSEHGWQAEQVRSVMPRLNVPQALTNCSTSASGCRSVAVRSTASNKSRSKRNTQ